MATWRNWSGEHEVRPRRYHRPGDEAEVIGVVRQVREAGERLRVVGAGHSWSAAAMCDDHMMNLDNMSAIKSVDAARCEVTVEAGIRLKTLVARMRDRGLGMSNLGSVIEQSVAGAISTGTHGTGLGFGNLPTQIVKMRLVNGRGEVVEIEDNTDLMNAARVSLGALGVITQVTVRGEPDFRLREETWSFRVDEAPEAIPHLIEQHEHIKFWWLPHTSKVQAFACTRSKEPVTPGLDRVEALDRLINKTVFPALLELGNRNLALVPLLNRLVSAVYFTPGSRVAEYERIFTLAMPPVHREAEYGIPVEQAGPMLVALRDEIERQNLRVNFITELRFMAADHSWLSPAYERASCQFGAYTCENADRSRFFQTFHDLALKHTPRPHWGKTSLLDHATLRENLPRMDDFLKLRREFDPDDVFVNDFTQRVFGL